MGDIFFLTDVAGAHYFTRDGTFRLGVNPAQPLPPGVVAYATEAEAERERLAWLARGVHLRVRRR